MGRQSKVVFFKCGEEGHGVAHDQCRNAPKALRRAEDKYANRRTNASDEVRRVT